MGRVVYWFWPDCHGLDDARVRRHSGETGEVMNKEEWKMLAKIFDLWEVGLNTYQISKQLNVHESVVYNLIARYQK